MVDSYTTTAGSGTWSVNVTPAQAQALADGVYTVTADVSDVAGNPAHQATSSVVRTNDAPVAVADVNSVKEDTPPNPVSGNVLANDTDVDTLDTHSVTAVNGSGANVGTDVIGTYGTLHLNADGSYTYTLANGQANVQALAEGRARRRLHLYQLRQSRRLKLVDADRHHQRHQRRAGGRAA